MLIIQTRCATPSTLQADHQLTATTSLPAARERALILILTAIHFTNVLDFVIMMPLGPQFMRVFAISPSAFGLLVSSYTFSAGVSGLFAAFFLDRVDRKRALLFCYAGFAIATFLCSLAPGYGVFLAARVLAGAFGGVLGALVFAVIGDVIPFERRGRATGAVMAAFSIASVLGVPAGMWLATEYQWHAPFLVLSVLALLVWIMSALLLPVLRGHIADGPARSPIETMRAVWSDANHRRAFALISALMFAGFTVVPFLSPYMVANVGLTERQLPLIYLAGGLATAISSPVVGRLADHFGKVRVFSVMSFASVPVIVMLTVLPPVRLAIALVATTLFMIVVSGRIVPAIALITSSPAPGLRGSFMSVNSSVQQFAAGVASFSAGLVIGQGPGGRITGYGTVGLIAAASTLLCVYIARTIIPRTA